MTNVVFRTCLRTLPAVLALSLITDAAAAGPKSVDVSASNTNGTAVNPSPSGTACNPADAIAFVGSDELGPANGLTSLPTELAVSLGILANGTGGGSLVASSMRFTNARGTLPARLESGSCDAPGLSLGPGAASGAGVWAVDGDAATGAFRQATGTGTFTLSATTQSGGANAWSLSVSGGVSVLQPSLSASLLSSSWAHQPGDPPGRIATVVYRLTNTGPGDGFAGAFDAPGSPTGFGLLSVTPASFGALPAGGVADVTVRWSVPTGAVREFDTAVHLRYTDALDQPSATDQSVHVVMPTR